MKAKDVKQFYRKKIQQLSLELEHLQGIILYEREHVEHCIDLFELEAHKHKWENNNVGFMFVERQLDQEFHETQQKLEKNQKEEKEAREIVKAL